MYSACRRETSKRAQQGWGHTGLLLLYNRPPRPRVLLCHTSSPREVKVKSGQECISKLVVLQVRSEDQQRQWHPRTWEKRRFSGLTLDLLNQEYWGPKSCVYKPSR